jgi:hypothetical protein
MTPLSPQSHGLGATGGVPLVVTLHGLKLKTPPSHSHELLKP